MLQSNAGSSEMFDLSAEKWISFHKPETSPGQWLAEVLLFNGKLADIHTQTVTQGHQSVYDL